MLQISVLNDEARLTPSAVCPRFSPYYRTKEKLSLRSVTHSNTVDPMKCFCRFDLTGTCNDDDCRWSDLQPCASQLCVT